MASTLIALTGVAGSGKSEVAKILQHNHFKVVKFATPLKNMLRGLYRDTTGLPEAEIERRIEGDLKEAPCVFLGGKTPRWAMQTLGTEWGRDCIHSQFWVDLWTSMVSGMRDRVVVDDCRFDNEAARVRSMGGVIWRVQRDGAGTASVHHSENGLTPHPDDILIENNGTLEDLRNEVLRLA